MFGIEIIQLHVMAALVAATHTLRLDGCSWVAGTSPAMTIFESI